MGKQANKQNTKKQQQQSTKHTHTKHAQQLLKCWFEKIIVFFKEMLSKKTGLHVDEIVSET